MCFSVTLAHFCQLLWCYFHKEHLVVLVPGFASPDKKFEMSKPRRACKNRWNQSLRRHLCDVRDKLLEKQKKQRENVTERVKAWKTFLLIQANQMSADGNPLKIKGARSHCRLGRLWSEEGENWTFNRFRKRSLFSQKSSEQTRISNSLTSKNFFCFFSTFSIPQMVLLALWT